MKMMLCVGCFWLSLSGCVSSSPASFTGSLTDIKAEQRGRLYLRCLQDSNDVRHMMPELMSTISRGCREWGRQMVR